MSISIAYSSQDGAGRSRGTCRLIIGLRVRSFGDESALSLGENIGAAHAEHLGDG